MSRVRRFTVITPCFNAAALVVDTVRSIIGQSAVASGRIELEYIVCDGASTDGTVDAIRGECGDRAVIISEPDQGMYDALAKGLRRASGEVVSYLNAGDVYHPTAFDVVADVMDQGRVRWLTGMRVTCNHKLQVIEALLPFPYRQRLLQKGLYGTVLPFVQQESTFWRRELHEALDLQRLSSLRYAGDYYLWQRFARLSRLVVVEAYLGGFTYHRGQKSEDKAAYRGEVRELVEPVGPLDWLRAVVDKRLGSLPAPIKKWLQPDGMVRYDVREGKWE